MEFDTPYKERLKSPSAISGDKNPGRETHRLLAKRDTLAIQQNKSQNSSNFSGSNSSSDSTSRKDLNRNELDMAQYMKKLFNTYGNGDTMTLDGFERMMDKLGLMRELSMKLDRNLLDEKKIDNLTAKALDGRVNAQNTTVSLMYNRHNNNRNT